MPLCPFGLLRWTPEHTVLPLKYLSSSLGVEQGALLRHFLYCGAGERLAVLPSNLHPPVSVRINAKCSHAFTITGLFQRRFYSHHCSHPLYICMNGWDRVWYRRDSLSWRGLLWLRFFRVHTKNERAAGSKQYIESMVW